MEMRRLDFATLAQSSIQPPEIGTPVATAAGTWVVTGASVVVFPLPRVTTYPIPAIAATRAAATPILTPTDSFDQALSVASMRKEGMSSDAAEGVNVRGSGAGFVSDLDSAAGAVRAATLGAGGSGAACRLIGAGL